VTVTALHAASQPANRRHRCKTAGSFRKMSFFGNDDPCCHKTNQMFWTWSVRVSVQNFDIVRHSVLEDIGHRQNKLTPRYLVDDILCDVL